MSQIPPEWAQWAPQPVEADPTPPTGAPIPPDPGRYFGEPAGPIAPPAHGGHGRLVSVIGVALVPLLLLGIVLMRASRGGTVGAATPQGAVNDLATAVDHQDVLGALAAVAPEESAAATTLVKAVIDKAQHTKLITDSAKPLAGVTAKVEGLQLTAHQLHPLVARVDVGGGTLAYSFDPAQLSSALRDDLGGSLTAQSGSVSAAEGQSAVASYNQGRTNKLSGVFVMTVKRNGRWFVSPFYTVAEYLRQSAGLPPANYDATTQGPLTGGATTPQGVVRNLFSLSLTDPATSLDTLPPDSLRVVYDYMGDVKAAVASLGQFGLTGPNAPRVDYRIDNLQTSSLPAGLNETQVDLDALTVTATVSDTVQLPTSRSCALLPQPDVACEPTTVPPVAVCPPGSDPLQPVQLNEKLTLSLNGTCYTEKTEGTSIPAQDAIASNSSSSGCLAKLAPGLKLDHFFIMTVKERGAWYVDPLGTVAAYVKVVVQQATAADVRCLLLRSHDQGEQTPATAAACSESTLAGHH